MLFIILYTNPARLIWLSRVCKCISNHFRIFYTSLSIYKKIIILVAVNLSKCRHSSPTPSQTSILTDCFELYLKMEIHYSVCSSFNALRADYHTFVSQNEFYENTGSIRVVCY